MSLQKSGRGANKPAKAAKPAKRGASGGGRGAARPAGGARQVYVQTAKNDVFTYLLAVSLGAIFIGIIFLVLLLNKYEWKTKVAGNAPSPNSTQLVASDLDLRIAPDVVS